MGECRLLSTMKSADFISGQLNNFKLITDFEKSIFLPAFCSFCTYSTCSWYCWDEVLFWIKLRSSHADRHAAGGVASASGQTASVRLWRRQTDRQTDCGVLLTTAGRPEGLSSWRYVLPPPHLFGLPALNAERYFRLTVATCDGILTAAHLVSLLLSDFSSASLLCNLFFFL